MSNYVLEGDEEFHRLEYQASLRLHDFREELSDFHVPRGGTILDAGCGSGIVTRHLAKSYPDSRVIGCDISERRLELARERSPKLPNLTFRVANLREPSFDAESFDCIFARLVIEHIMRADQVEVMRQFLRGLKPGGTLRLVGIDGYLFGVHPAPSPIPEFVQGLRAFDGIDLEIGRKIPLLMHSGGFERIDTKIQNFFVQPIDVEDMSVVVDWSLKQAGALILKLMGSEERVRALHQAYADVLRTPGSVFFWSRFIVTGVKPMKAG